MHQLIEKKRTSVNIADMIDEHFAMDPKCCTELTHPNNCWSPLTIKAWVIHHVQPERMVCMFKADVQGGLYKLVPKGTGGSLGLGANAEADTHEKRTMRHWVENFGGEMKYDTPEKKAFWEQDLSVNTALNMIDVLSYEDAPASGAADSRDPMRKQDLPDLCHCVDTEPPHPGQPKQSATTTMEETEAGPRLAHLQFAGMTRTGATEQRLTTGEL